MKTWLSAIFVLLTSISSPLAKATILPDACGDDKIKFSVATQKDQPAPVPPAAGKAQIIFVEDEKHMIGTLMYATMYATVRYGLDGAWAGANYSNSYFVVNVEPGEHHLCASWQSKLGPLKKNIDVSSFTAEAGKVYYFAAEVKVVPVEGGVDGYAFSMKQLNDDEGKFRVKAWKLATSKPK